MSVGTYEGATRFPFNSPTEPGLSADGDGRGCNDLTGRFEVLEIVGGLNGQLQRLAVNFEQHCEGAAPALFGILRYNSDVPADQPPPTPVPPTVTPTSYDTFFAVGRLSSKSISGHTACADADPSCAADCNNDQLVTVDELILGGNIVLGNAPLTACPALDCHHTGHVGADCVVRAIDSAINGCGGS